MIFLLGLFLTFFIGLGLMRLIVPNLSVWEQIVLAWVIGLGLATQELFLLAVFNIQYSVITLLVPLAIISLLFFLSFRQKFKTNLKLNLSVKAIKKQVRYLFEKFSLMELIIIFLLAVLITGVFIRAVYWPVNYWDALAWYDYRGKIFFEAGGIAIASKLASIPIHGAPPMTSLSHTFVYLLGGNNSNPQFIYPLYYIALLVVFYFSVRKYCLRWVSLIFTFVLASIPFFVEFASNAYTNLPYAFYFGAGIIYLYRFMQEKSFGLLILSGILLGLSAWTRSPTEQFFIATTMVLVLWCLKEKKYYLAPPVLVFLFLLFFLPWKFYLSYTMNIPFVAVEIGQAINSGTSSPINLERFFEVVFLLFQSIKGVSGTSLLLALMVTIFFPKKAKSHIYLLMILLVNFGLFVLGSYAFSLSWHDWHDSIANSANRLSMFLPPFVLYYTAILVPGFLNKDKKQ